VLDPVVYEPSWDHEFSVYKWFSVQEGNQTLLYANFHGADPNAANVEINVRRNCFYPDRTGVDYITLSGFTVKQAATTWAPPTAYQEGMVGPHWSKGWIIEDCEISDSKCSGISLGKYLQPNNENYWTLKRLKHGTQTERDSIIQAQREGWTKENIGSHIVRRCHIHDCEQTGIVGHLGGVFSVIEDNHIHHINTKQQLAGAEIGGIKMHAAIDTVIRRNHIHHCTRGLWLDWQAQGRGSPRTSSTTTSCPPERRSSRLSSWGGPFIEVSHGPTLVDNNIFLPCTRASSRPRAWRTCTTCLRVLHQRGDRHGQRSRRRRPQPRYTPYHLPHRTEVAGFMTFLHGDDRFYNNIFVQQDVPRSTRNTGSSGLHHEQGCGTVPSTNILPGEYLASSSRKGRVRQGGPEQVLHQASGLHGRQRLLQRRGALQRRKRTTKRSRTRACSSNSA
jgi:hypothetical protein